MLTYFQLYSLLFFLSSIVILIARERHAYAVQLPVSNEIRVPNIVLIISKQTFKVKSEGFLVSESIYACLLSGGVAVYGNTGCGLIPAVCIVRFYFGIFGVGCYCSLVFLA